MEVRKYSIAGLAAVIAAGMALSASADHSWGDYHWARTTSSFTLQTINSTTAQWDYAFVESLARPMEILEGELPPPLPPAGPARARALQLLSADVGGPGRGVLDRHSASGKGKRDCRLWAGSASGRSASRPRRRVSIHRCPPSNSSE